MTDFVTFKARQQQAWSTGDFTIIAQANVLMGELLCEALDLRSGQHVLDVATGSGNTALAAARRRCEVIGLDWAPLLLERGRERAAAERLPITFQEGDVEQLPFPAATFDAVLSTAGAMYAPDQEQTARELLRVCRPGGKIGMANFTPDSFNAEFSRLLQQCIPPPAGLPSAFRWGTEAGLRALFGEAITSLQVTPRAAMFRYRSVQEWLEVWRTSLGPLHQAFLRLDTRGQTGLADDLVALAQRYNRSGDATLVVPSVYLEVVATKR
jgi:ubiquinone/menaquinone biosynthesis C-methylase UbiE